MAPRVKCGSNSMASMFLLGEALPLESLWSPKGDGFCLCTHVSELMETERGVIFLDFIIKIYDLLRSDCVFFFFSFFFFDFVLFYFVSFLETDLRGPLPMRELWPVASPALWSAD